MLLRESQNCLTHFRRGVDRPLSYTVRRRAFLPQRDEVTGGGWSMVSGESNAHGIDEKYVWFETKNVPVPDMSVMSLSCKESWCTLRNSRQSLMKSA